MDEWRTVVMLQLSTHIHLIFFLNFLIASSPLALACSNTMHLVKSLWDSFVNQFQTFLCCLRNMILNVHCLARHLNIKKCFARIFHVSSSWIGKGEFFSVCETFSCFLRTNADRGDRHTYGSIAPLSNDVSIVYSFLDVIALCSPEESDFCSVTQTHLSALLP